MTVWMLVHRSEVSPDEVIEPKIVGFFETETDAGRAKATLVERFASYRAAAAGFEVFELELDREIPAPLSNRIMWG